MLEEEKTTISADLSAGNAPIPHEVSIYPDPITELRNELSNQGRDLLYLGKVDAKRKASMELAGFNLSFCRAIPQDLKMFDAIWVDDEEGDWNSSEYRNTVYHLFDRLNDKGVVVFNVPEGSQNELATVITLQMGYKIAMLRTRSIDGGPDKWKFFVSNNLI